MPPPRQNQRRGVRKPDKLVLTLSKETAYSWHDLLLSPAPLESSARAEVVSAAESSSRGLLRAKGGALGRDGPALSSLPRRPPRHRNRSYARAVSERRRAA